MASINLTNYDLILAPNAWSKGNGTVAQYNGNFPAYPNGIACVMTGYNAAEGYKPNTSDGYIEHYSHLGFIRCPIAWTLTDTSKNTIEIWYRHKNNATADTYLWGNYTDIPRATYAFINRYGIANSNRITYYCGTAIWRTDVSLVDGELYHLVFIKDEETLAIYINGAVTGYDSYNGTYSDGNVVLASTTDFGSIIAASNGVNGQLLWLGISTSAAFDITRISTNYAEGPDGGYVGVNTSDVMDLIDLVVTFDSQGGSTVSSQSGIYNELITEPTDPMRIGYIFGGWYTEIEYTNLWNFSTDTITTAITLYAKWIETNIIGTEYKQDYITICGAPQPIRFGTGRKIDLINFLPDYLKETETSDLLKFFEDYLNELFDGLEGMTQTETLQSTSASSLTNLKVGSVHNITWTDIIDTSAVNIQLTTDNEATWSYIISSVFNDDTYEVYNSYSWTVLNIPSTQCKFKITSNTDSNVYAISDLFEISNTNSTSNATVIKYNTPENITTNKISILEKINRLTETHDPDLIDLDYIQYFANNLGYNVNINRGELGTIATTDFGVCSGTNVDKYLRFVIRELPNWYKIKTTRNAVKVMLYSFGLIGDISQYFADKYSTSGNWVAPDYSMESESLSNISNDKFPTPHFIIWIDLNQSTSDLSFDFNNRNQIINAVESIKPINTVFRNLGAYFRDIINLYVGINTRFMRYIKVENDGYADFWA